MTEAKKTEKKKVEIKKCSICHGNGPDSSADMFEFCSECGMPSAAYQDFIYSEMRMNGEL
jgi:hypothetical protein